MGCKKAGQNGARGGGVVAGINIECRGQAKRLGKMWEARQCMAGPEQKRQSGRGPGGARGRGKKAR